MASDANSFRFIDHAQKELERRGIPLQIVLEALQQPDQIVANMDGREAYHKLVEMNDKTYLLRIIVEHGDTVITVYRTSKVQKYWR